MELIRKHWIKLAIGAGAAACAYAYFAGRADAADLGGNCCADLEERIAELEATTARKGTKATSLNIYGQVNKSILYYDVDDADISETKVIENGASETFVGFAAKVQIRKDWAAGGVIELGQGRTFIHLRDDVFDGDVSPTTGTVAVNNEIYTRQSYVFLATPAGRVSVGLLSMATDDLTAASVANTDAAVKRLTLQPLGGVVFDHWLFGNMIDAELEPFNGKKADAVRYDSPAFGGFSASAAWESDSASYDAALRYAGELGGFVVIAAAGYEVDKADDLTGATETKTFTLNGGVRHVVSGIFVQGSWARLDIDTPLGSGDTDAWHAQAGWEGRLFEIGTTTVWAGYAEWSDLDLESVEVGLNQNISGAADAYVLGRTYELGGSDAYSVLGGMRLRF
jgi:predicted porin